MATTVLQTNHTLYDEDLAAWVDREVGHLKSGRLDRLDVPHLIEELEGMAGNLRRELKNRLRILLAHLLKWQFQPKRRSRSWAGTIVEQRDQIAALLEESPSLQGYLEEAALSAYPRAVRLAAIETGLPRSTFPAELPYSLSRILEGESEQDQGS